MSPDERLEDAQDAWHVAFEAGHDRPVADLLPDAPDLQPELERRVAVLRRMLTAQQQAPPAVAPAGPISLPPGFVFERELGRGGMGVVYLARQAGLNRLAAVKMILDAAGPSAVIRFLAEAEAVASVKHPNVVEVYQFGEHQGKPYLALEFCVGGDLTAKSKGGRTDPRQSAELMAAVADGVNAAHSAGIVHRDLKPGNILLAADGTPKVSDFGLAKKGVGADLTGSEAVLGTAAYMSPEQAGGGAKFVGPESDVWALGVMLYELLTGVRPFVGPSFLDYRIQILGRQLTPLRQAFPDVPRDLELIVAKCLRQEPRERYATAGELAADLLNWLTGRPISARPMGSVEAAWKWSRRNPAVAGSLVVAVLALVVGTGISLWQANEAQWHASVAHTNETEAQRQRKEAETARQRETESRIDAEQAERKADGEKVRAQQSLAKGLLGPIQAIQPDYPFTEHEIDTFVELTALRDGPVGLMLLEQTTRSPRGVRQLLCRSPNLDHAVVGLDSAKRKQVDAMLTGRLRDAALPHDLRHNVVLAAVDAERFADPDAMAELLLGKLEKAKNFADTSRLIKLLMAVAGKQSVDRGAETLLATLGMMGTNDGPREVLAKELAAMSEKLPPQRRDEVCGKSAIAILTRLAKTTLGEERFSLVKGLVAVCDKLPADKKDEFFGNAAEVLLAALSNARMEFDWLGLAENLAVVAGKLPPDRAAEVCGKAAEVLLAAMVTKSTRYDWKILAEGLAAVAGKLPPDRAAEVCAKAADVLLASMITSKEMEQRARLAECLAVVCSKMPTDKWTEMLIIALDKTEMLVTPNKTTTSVERTVLANSLAVVAGKLPPDDAAKRYGQAAEVVLTSWNKATGDSERELVAKGLAALTEKLPPDKGAEVLFAVLSVTRTAARTANEWCALTAGVVAVARMLPADRATELCKRAIANFETHRKLWSGADRGILANSLVLVCGRLPADQAAEVLLAALQNATHDARKVLAAGLAAVAGNLPAIKAAEMCGKASQVLLDALRNAMRQDHRFASAAGLVAVCGRLPADEAAEMLLALLNDARDGSEWNVLALGLAAACGQLPAAKATEVCGKAAVALLANWENATQPFRPEALAAGLAGVAGNLPAEEATELLFAALCKVERGEVRQVLAAGLSVVASGLSPDGFIQVQHAPELAALTGVVTIHPDVLPKPRPLPPQQLIDLLKHPFCVKEARRAVLDALEFTYDRKFGDLWEFVAFAEKEHPELDLLTPPKRQEKQSPSMPAK